ncbi:hypothetical protein, partial [Postechiella marina]|uniref:hypothetical protein n=1 Tax=Postechiella marina TaxID=943941 RepID=UPI0031DC7437
YHKTNTIIKVSNNLLIEKNTFKYMKSQHYIIPLILFVFSFSQAISAQTVREQLIGSWTFDYDTSITKMDTSAKKHHVKMREASKQKFIEAFKGRIMVFNADGSYKQELSKGSKGNGTWLITPAGSLEITMKNGREIIFTIDHLNIVSLVLKPIETAGNPLMTYWQLSKN